MLYIHGLVVVCNDASADLFVHRAADIGGFYYYFFPPQSTFVRRCVGSALMAAQLREHLREGRL